MISWMCGGLPAVMARLRDEGLRSLLSVPLLANRELIGVLGLGEHGQSGFSGAGSWRSPTRWPHR